MKPPRLFLQLPATLRRVVVAVLLVALPLYGLGGALVQMLGPDHRHEALADADHHGGSWADLVGRQLQALVGPETARLVENLRLQARLRPAAAGHSHGVGAHHHHHGGAFARHHHAPHDASVVSVGARAEGQGSVDAAAAGSMAMPLALMAELRIPAAAAQAVRWPGHAAARWHSHVPGLPERPPRA